MCTIDTTRVISHVAHEHFSWFCFLFVLLCFIIFPSFVRIRLCLLFHQVPVFLMVIVSIEIVSCIYCKPNDKQLDKQLLLFWDKLVQ